MIWENIPEKDRIRLQDMLMNDATIKEIAIRDKNLGNVEDFIAYQKQTLRHEIIHAFMNESGLQDSWQHAQQFGHDETTVDWFAIQSPKIYKVFNELDVL